MRVVAVVVNWNDAVRTARALRSLLAEGIDAICVDNGSEDGSAALLSEQLAGLTLLETGANLGFAGGNNAGIRYALEHGYDWVWLVNNDATAVSGSARALAEAARERPDAGVLACVVLRADDPALVEFAGARFRALLGYSGRVSAAGGRLKELPTTLGEVERAAGTAMAVSRAAIEAAGLLDEQLFAYVEEVDWCLRIRDRGFAVVLVPGARVRHEGSAATGGRSSTASLYYDTRNTIVVCERHRPLPHGARALRRGVVVAAHLAQTLGHPRPRQAARAVISGWLDARRGRLGPRPPGRAPRAPGRRPPS